MTLTDLFQKVTFLLGAGASKDAGCYLSGEMLDSLRDDIRSELDDSSRRLEKHFCDIHDFVLASLSYQFTLRNPSTASQLPRNIEDFVAILNQIIDKEYIVPYPLVGNWNDKISRWETINADIFKTFRDFIERMLITKYLKHDKSRNEILLAPIKDLICQTDESFEIDFFTLNYDLTFENYFNSSEESLLNDGFEGDKWTGSFEQKPQNLNYHKLHGSVNWYLDPIEETVKARFNEPISKEPLIIFGSASKMLSFDPFLFMLSNFRQKLDRSTLYVVIGYSFHDKYINNLLIQQLAMKPEKKLLVVDPFVENNDAFASKLDQIQRMKSISDRINFIQISRAKIQTIAITAEAFYKTYFYDSARKLSQTLETVLAEERPFE